MAIFLDPKCDFWRKQQLYLNLFCSLPHLQNDYVGFFFYIPWTFNNNVCYWFILQIQSYYLFNPYLLPFLHLDFPIFDKGTLILCNNIMSQTLCTFRFFIIVLYICFIQIKRTFKFFLTFIKIFYKINFCSLEYNILLSIQSHSIHTNLSTMKYVGSGDIFFQKISRSNHSKPHTSPVMHPW